MATTAPIQVQGIHVRAVDNELYILASNGNAAGSYEICHLKAGNNNKVDYIISQLNWIVPPGPYTLIMVGINWGAGQVFTVDLIDPPRLPTTYTAPPSTLIGANWTVAVPITV